MFDSLLPQSAVLSIDVTDAVTAFTQHTTPLVVNVIDNYPPPPKK